LQAQADAEKREWQEQHLQALLFVRIEMNGMPVGVLGIGSNTRAIAWTDEQIDGLKLLAAKAMQN
jgi:GAF domain-containing protein